MPSMVYGDITPRQAAFSVANLLKRAQPLLVIERFGQVYVLPKNNTRVAKFRRYFLENSTGSVSGNAGNAGMPLALTPLVEGVTPAGRKLSNKDYTVQLEQYGDFVGFTDVIMDIHEDMPAVLRELTDILGEQAAQTVETLRFNVLKAGTNVFYANQVASRSLVAAKITLADQRRVTTALNRQNARKITSVVASKPDFNTKSVEAAYVAVVHPDLETDIREMTGFKPVADYGPHTSPWEGEIGSVEQVRYIATTVAKPFLAAGVVVASAPTMRSNGGVNIDVYPVLYFARDAFGIVPLKGHSSMTPMVVNPKPAPGDPLGQRGTVGWKLWTATVILQEAFMVRLEVAATA